MSEHTVVSREEWLQARKALLAREKDFNHLRDELSLARRQLPWVRVEKPYVFDGPDGRETLAQLFAGRHQLIVYHFMFDPGWEVGCKSCSFWADNFNGVIPHLNQRDVTLIAVSRAPWPKLDAFRRRLGWTFKWVSSSGSDFNYDFHVSSTEAEQQRGEFEYNYETRKTSMPELPGISVFYRDDSGAVYHAYSSYARGLDMMNVAYHYLDLVPKGRDETGPHAMSWVRLHDEYAT